MGAGVGAEVQFSRRGSIREERTEDERRERSGQFERNELRLSKGVQNQTSAGGPSLLVTHFTLAATTKR